MEDMITSVNDRQICDRRKPDHKAQKMKGEKYGREKENCKSMLFWRFSIKSERGMLMNRQSTPERS